MSRDSQESGGSSLIPGPPLGVNGSFGAFRAPSPEISIPHSGVSINSNGTTNVGVPTLTTPTLTPTTLRNIEQMFAESDPNEPPHHHENAAGFVPPIVSPTSGNSFNTLGLDLSTDGDRDEESESSAPTVNAQPPPPPASARPRSESFTYSSGPEDLSSPRPSSAAAAVERRSLRPQSLSLSLDTPAASVAGTVDRLQTYSSPEKRLARPQSLNLDNAVSLDLTRPKVNRPVCLSIPSSKVIFGQRKLSAGSEVMPTAALPSPTRPGLVVSVTRPPPVSPGGRPPPPSSLVAVAAAASRPQSLVIAEPHNLAVNQTTAASDEVTVSLDSSGPQNLSLSRPKDLALTRPTYQNFTEAEDLTVTRPNSLPIGLHNGGGLPAKNIEFLEKFLKAAAASSPMLNTPTSAMILSPVKEISTNNTSAMSPASTSNGRSPSPPDVPPLYIAQPRPGSPSDDAAFLSAAYRKSGESGDNVTPLEEEEKKALRRERNKQAAARCRKRRLDLTLKLQDEVSDWEQKVRALKDQLLELEAQKKGLESVLHRHSGPCKVSKKT